MLMATLAGITLLGMGWDELVELYPKRLPGSESILTKFSYAGLAILAAVSVTAILLTVKSLGSLVWHDFFGKDHEDGQ